MVHFGRSTIQNTVLKQLNYAALVSSDILVISPDGAGLGEAPVLLLGDHLPQTRLVLEQRADVDHERVPHPAPEVGEGPVELDWRDVARGHLHQHPRDDGHALPRRRRLRIMLRKHGAGKCQLEVLRFHFSLHPESEMPQG